MIELSGQLVPVKVDCDKEEGLQKKYNIRAYPTIIFADGKGKVLGKIRGAPNAKYLTEKMQQYIKVNNELVQLQAKFEADPTDLETGGLLAGVYANAGNDSLARKYIKAVEKADPDNQKGYLTEAYLAMGDHYVEQEKFSSAVKYYEQAYTTSKDPAAVSEARYNGALAHFESRKEASDKSKNYEKRLLAAKEQLDLLLKMAEITDERKKQAEELLVEVSKEIEAYNTRRGDKGK
ncbi:MAG: hypothetical protein HJJLKODD_01991 [Phycisphaerae bacterium]|nr:hypothetical protein [Phycisphaerae bacterium]